MPAIRYPTIGDSPIRFAIRPKNNAALKPKAIVVMSEMSCMMKVTVRA
jgi:hypothetical protein